MHYPIITEQQLAERWKVSVKTLRRWRQAKTGPKWWKLSKNVRYHEVDIDAYEFASSQHMNRFLGRDEADALMLKPVASIEEETQARTLLSAQDVADITGLPSHIFSTRSERDRRRIPYLNLVGVLRFDIEAVLQWELDNSIPGIPEKPVILEDVTDQQADSPEPPPRWYEIVKKQNQEQFDSLGTSD